ncbi:TetR/AcrR family transcriptional regulator [Cryptosporangium phraense]|uniref:TetR/AcrR family transcriptional regulator n=2 Tax=Cryptosporangium phraense TaxID=2593070 RepID=A0A545AZC0_9ACTN|nr:TetR/AcrR family transcriptional regulator [Cryptosporangium phraense]
MVLRAAVVEFARGGLDGTSTETIAQRAGISQPYLFRLFPNKKALFVAAVERCFQQVLETFEEAAEGLAGEDAMVAIANAYGKLITDDRDLLMLQLQAYAAGNDVDVRAATRTGYGHLWQAVQRISGVDDDAIRQFFAYGMLWNTVAAMNLDEYDAPWAQMCLPDDMRGKYQPKN